MCGAIWIDTPGAIRNYSVDSINYSKPGGKVQMAAPHIAVLSSFFQVGYRPALQRLEYVFQLPLNFKTIRFEYSRHVTGLPD